jgi:hypothetical protein
MEGDDSVALVANMRGPCGNLWALVAGALVVGIVAVAHARLGENITACDMRYNKGAAGASTSEDRLSPLVIGPGTTNRTYRYEGWKIRIGFLNETACRLAYRLDGKMVQPSAEEFSGILQAHGGTSAWRQVETRSITNAAPAVMKILRSHGARLWVRQDGALAYPYGSMVVVESPAALMLDVQDAQRREAAKQRKVPQF